MKIFASVNLERINGHFVCARALRLFRCVKRQSCELLTARHILPRLFCEQQKYKNIYFCPIYREAESGREREREHGIPEIVIGSHRLHTIYSISTHTHILKSLLPYACDICADKTNSNIWQTRSLLRTEEHTLGRSHERSWLNDNFVRSIRRVIDYRDTPIGLPIQAEQSAL